MAALARLTRELIDYAERLTRAAIAALPDGTYRFRDHIDDDGIDVGVPIPLVVAVTKQGDAMHVDWTGSAPPGEGRDQQHAVLHQVGELLRDPLDPARQHPEQRRGVPRHHGDRGRPARWPTACCRPPAPRAV